VTTGLRDNEGGDDIDAVFSSQGNVGLVDDRPQTERQTGNRSGPVQFIREIGDELRQVSWPTRSELINYTAVVFFTLVLMIALIFVLNLGLGKAVVYMFQK
jgi:preprotein translocase subunit SecE